MTTTAIMRVMKMATIINGATIVEQTYEFGVESKTGEVIECPGYDVATDVLLVEPNAKLKMRVHYVTEWMDAQ